MSTFEQLPPDQRATLSLILRRRKSYAEVAAMLEISPQAVHDRAHAALAVLAPALARRLEPPLRNAVSEYLLGQLSDEEAAKARAKIASSAPAREWAKAVAVELVHVTADQLPEIPEAADSKPATTHDADDEGDFFDEDVSDFEGSYPGTEVSYAAAEASRAAALANAAGAAAPVSSAGTADAVRDARRGRGYGERPRASRTGGIVLLSAIGVIIVVVLVLVLTGGKGKSSNTGKEVASTKTGTTQTTTSSSESISVEADEKLKAANGGTAAGQFAVAAKEGKSIFIIEGSGLQPTGSGVDSVWLVKANGEVKGLGIAKVGSDGKLPAVAGDMPSEAKSYDKVELTYTASAKPTEPGEVLLEGSLKLH